jgi:hypothetical protein
MREKAADNLYRSDLILYNHKSRPIAQCSMFAYYPNSLFLESDS